MPLKITGMTKCCRECPNRVYYSGGVYECTAAGNVQIKTAETDTIPDWCPLPDSTQKERRYILSGGLCVTCSQHMANELMPPHDASPRCKSGKRNHCFCDVCF